jgi:lactam utilization protein B
VRTICIHGDTPNAAAIALAVRTALRDAGYAIAPADAS